MTFQLIAKTLARGIPGVPIAALDAIQDENTRMVLRSIVDGWHVRNGSTGSGDASFVTRSEIGDLTRIAAADEVKRALPAMRLDPGELSRIGTDLYNQVFESQLFKELESRVDLVDKPGGLFDRMGAAELAAINETQQRIAGDTGLSTQLTALGVRVGQAETAIVTENQQRVNADNALNQSVSTQFASVNGNLALLQSATTTNANNVAALVTKTDQLQASLNGAYAAIQTEQQVRANADGQLYAQYTVKVDTNGYVTGFGLANTVNNGTPTSSFIVRTDTFSIVSPTGNRAAVIMANNTINVFDENGALRVRIGKLA